MVEESERRHYNELATYFFEEESAPSEPGD
jgi:hypothetical protein